MGSGRQLGSGISAGDGTTEHRIKGMKGEPVAKKASKQREPREVSAGPVTAAGEVRHREPEVSTRIGVPPVPEDRGLWPKDKPMPTQYIKTPFQVIPCPNCRRIYQTTGGYGQAVVCTSSGFDRAAFRCRCCNHTFTLPVKRIEP